MVAGTEKDERGDGHGGARNSFTKGRRHRCLKFDEIVIGRDGFGSLCSVVGVCTEIRDVSGLEARGHPSPTINAICYCVCTTRNEPR